MPASTPCVLHPVFDARLGSVAFDYDSPYGTIHSDWKITGSTAVWHLTLPANTSGKLTLTPEAAKRFRLKPEAQTLQIDSGTSDFTFDLK